MFKLDFEPVGRRGEVSADQSLLESARDLDVDIVSICGGIGSCDHCKVQIISGKVSGLTLEEESILSEKEIEEGFRMACRAYPLSDLTIHVPPESLSAPQRTQVEGLESSAQFNPLLRGYVVESAPPTLENPEADDHQLRQAFLVQGVAVEKIDYHVMHKISPVLRENDWRVGIAMRGNEVVAIGRPQTRWLGMAVDIGTTKIAAYLLDMESGETLASKGEMNPQISYGEDVIARIAVANRSPDHAKKMQTLLVDALNELALSLSAAVDGTPEDIVDTVIVGNTAIHHLLLGLPVKQLGESPYVPTVKAALDIKAHQIGLKIAAGAYIHLLPNIAGFVGADHVSMLLATRIVDAEGITLAIDIGTNTEICLNNRGKLISTSCASGPAFEGAHIKFGMRAAPGAIEHVRVTGDRLDIQTIGNEPPIGVCGSGLLDVISQLRLNGILNRAGKMTEHSLTRKNGKATEFILAERDDLEPIVLSQKDVRELQMAKAAIRLGIQALVEAEGLSEQDIERVIIAGAFGTFIDIESAIVIGMFPDLPLERFEQVGNAAGTGARMALISQDEREKAQEIASRDGYIELAKMPDFNRRFIEATYL